MLSHIDIWQVMPQFSLDWLIELFSTQEIKVMCDKSQNHVHTSLKKATQYKFIMIVRLKLSLNTEMEPQSAIMFQKRNNFDSCRRMQPQHCQILLT